jgi:hypothetical protein
LHNSLLGRCAAEPMGFSPRTVSESRAQMHKGSPKQGFADIPPNKHLGGTIHCKCHQVVVEDVLVRPRPEEPIERLCKDGTDELVGGPKSSNMWETCQLKRVSNLQASSARLSTLESTVQQAARNARTASLAALRLVSVIY